MTTPTGELVANGTIDEGVTIVDQPAKYPTR